MSQDDFKGMPTVAVDASLPIKNVRSLNQSHVSRFSAAGAAVIGGAPYSGLPLGLVNRRDSRTQMEGGSVSDGVRARAEVNMEQIANQSMHSAQNKNVPRKQGKQFKLMLGQDVSAFFIFRCYDDNLLIEVTQAPIPPHLFFLRPLSHFSLLHGATDRRL